MTTLGNIEDIERQLRAPATSFRELILAGAVFVRLADVVDVPSSSFRYDDERPLAADVLPHLWPTVGDLRRLRDALVVAGWKPDEAF